MAIVRNIDGFTACQPGDPLSKIDLGNIRKWAIHFEDFLNYDITQVVGGNAYTFTATNCVDTIAGPTGLLVLTLGGADNDTGQLQITSAPFQTNGKKLYFEIKLNLTLATGTVAANEIYVGLAGLQTTTNFVNAGGTALTADNFMGFTKFDTQSKYNACLRASDVESTDIGVSATITDTVDTTLAFYYDGLDVYFYENQALIARLNNNIPTAIMSPVIVVKAGEAKANILKVDYVLVAAERA